MRDSAGHDIAAEVASARRVAWHLSLYSWLLFVAGWIVMIVSLLAWWIGHVGFFDAIDVLLAIGFASVLSGLAMFATSWNMRLAATRLEVAAGSRQG